VLPGNQNAAGITVSYRQTIFLHRVLLLGLNAIRSEGKIITNIYVSEML
jgi:hypothetical protein